MPFSGFPRSTLYTPVPNLLFGPLLERIADLAELKVTLRGLWLLHQKRGTAPRPRALSAEEFLNDRVLLLGLKAAAEDPREEIRRGLRLAVERQIFLLYQPDPEAPEKHFYLLNTEADRQALAQIQQGKRLAAGSAQGQRETDTEEILTSPLSQRGDRGDFPINIFALYEDNVGMISPLLAEELKEAEGLYPWNWINEAFKIAVRENKRNWRYISAILRRWADEGKDDGKPGRHSTPNDPKKYLEEYKRRRGLLPEERAGR